MIDLHTHTLLSDGGLLPSEMVRRAQTKGYSAIALTDHVDSSNIDFVLPRLVKVSRVLNKSWKILVLPGVEVTHAPLEEFRPLVRYARSHGAKVVVGHGETVSEPVIPGTNRAAIEAGVTVLAHPGMIDTKDIRLAKRRGVFLEITTRTAHSSTNKRLVQLGLANEADFVLNTDAHEPEDLISDEQATEHLKELGLGRSDIVRILHNSEVFVRRFAKKR